MKRKLGEVIESHIQASQITKTELAERMGLSRQGLYKIINNETQEAKLSTVVSLAVALRVHPISLLQKMFDNWQFPAIETAGANQSKDATGFIGDLNYPDYSLVSIGQTFTKKWRSQNLGTRTWQGCKLKCFDQQIEVSTDNGLQLLDHKRGLKAEQQEIAIPTVEPGDTVDLAVTFTAPNYPCTTISYWKMVDKDGQVCFPDSEGLSCLVQVVKL